MAERQLAWPLEAPLSDGARVVLATQGIRLWTAECRVRSRGDALHIWCADATTLHNLRRQSRVAFSILDPALPGVVRGSGVARMEGEAASAGVSIRVEPYRLAFESGHSYERRLAGWTLVPDAPPPDVRQPGFWYKAFRAVTLPLSALPVLLGAAAAFAQGHFDPLLLLLALAGGLLAHAGANALADYFDFKNGVDLSGALSSHLGALAGERVEPEWILLAAFACLSATGLIGVVLVQLTGWPLLLFGLAGVLGSYSYTGRPLSFKYRALGEPLLGILMGPTMVMGSYYVQTRGWDWVVFVLSLAFAMIVASISLVNNLRDLPDDQAAGIRTLPMVLGVARTKKLYYLLTAGPFALALASIVANPAFWPLAAVFAALPRARVAINVLRDTADDVRDIRLKALARPYPLYSIRLHARFGALAVFGLVVAGLLPLASL